MWVLTSKRHRGEGHEPPRVEWKLGEITIAYIIMANGKKGGPWTFYLHTWDNQSYDTFNSFGEALSELHRRLSSPPPEGYETK
jgi:hypothetical protein